MVTEDLHTPRKCRMYKTKMIGTNKSSRKQTVVDAMSSS